MKKVIPMPDREPYTCWRQRAGPLVKECRALRPRFAQDDSVEERADKEKIKRGPATRRTVDRMELLLALMGPSGVHYTLGFDDRHLPDDFAGVRRALRAFQARASRRRAGEPLDWLYAIEGLHGDHRYHVHWVCDYRDFSPEEIRHIWGQCEIVDDEPVLRYRIYRGKDGVYRKDYSKDGGFRRLAKYLNKERPDGVKLPLGRHPWSCSRSLRARLPPCERWRDCSGVIWIPESSVWAARLPQPLVNDFGGYDFASWIDGDLLSAF